MWNASYGLWSQNLNRTIFNNFTIYNTTTSISLNADSDSNRLSNIKVYRDIQTSGAGNGIELIQSSNNTFQNVLVDITRIQPDLGGFNFYSISVQTDSNGTIFNRTELNRTSLIQKNSYSYNLTFYDVNFTTSFGRISYPYLFLNDSDGATNGFNASMLLNLTS